MECPAESVLIDLVARTVATEPASALEVHLADCADCRRLAFALASESVASATGAPRHRIGRFEVIAEVGAGAMGRVYRARDPGLEREVAIKVRRALTALGSDSDERLRREGQALARLSHPHVIAVHETGIDDGASYIVMEYVEGVTLDRWVATPRSVPAVIEVLAGVARGLAAAHSAGLVHRDVKPGNILVTPDGAAKIGDFGLARLEFDRAAPGPALPTGELTLTLSVTGSLIGTPAYMAPEQLQGGVASERSDQFGFCVTLFEAVTGHRPFGGRTTTELVAAIARGLPPAALDGLPARLRAVLARGLALDPARRYPSMTALVEALQPRATRARWLAVAGATGLAVAGALLARSADPVDRCGVPDGRIPQMFGAPRRVVLAARFAAAGPRGVDEARVAGDLLIAYGDRWQAAEATSCRASGGQPARLRDRQHACLERRLARADDLAALLVQPAAGAPVTEAARAIEALGDPAACLRIAAEGAEREPPAAGFAPLLAAYDRQVDHLVNLVRMRRGAEAREVEGLVAAVRALGAPALLSRALAAQAEVYAQRERFAEIEALLDEAGREGARAGDDLLVAQAWTFRVFVLSEHLGRPQEARRWLAAADAAVLRAGNPPELRAQLHQMAAVMYSSSGEHAQARREIEAAVALRERYQPAAVLALAATYNSLASVLEHAGQKADARRQYERALALVRERHGDLHRDVPAILVNLGDLLSEDDPRQAIGVAQQARRIAVQLAGPSSQFVAISLEIEGSARSQLGEHGAAAALYRQALDLTRARSGAMHARVAGILGKLVDEELALGDHAAAVRDARECLRIFAATLGPHDTSLADAHDTLGDALRRAGDAAGAIAEYRTALAIYETSDDHGGEQAAMARVDLGHLLANTGDAGAACTQFARAEPVLRPAQGENHTYALLALAGLVACDAADRRVERARLRALDDAVAAERELSPEAIGFTAFARAQARAQLGDRGQARSLAAAARAAFVKAGMANRSDVPARALAAIQ